MTNPKYVAKLGNTGWYIERQDGERLPFKPFFTCAAALDLITRLEIAETTQP